MERLFSKKKAREEALCKEKNPNAMAQNIICRRVCEEVENS